MPTPASRPPFYTTLLAFVLAQVIVAIIVRWLLWPMAGKMWVLRSFARQDLIVIAGFAAVVLAMALALGRTRRGRVPVTVLAIMRAVLPMRLAGSPWPLPGLAASCALVAATAHPAKADYWRDGVSNPAQALWSGMWQSGPDELLRAKGDGRTSAYAPRPAIAAVSVSASSRTIFGLVFAVPYLDGMERVRLLPRRNVPA